ncbi:hypothetical protein GCM10023231_29630 [Olivibacter ginsenosidimutans]|uniref:Uncharacterized protein n=1 Tax=Olivibacter ginsenosidimutans TaxID=1176537 RepID=A0ABP9BUX1_9SPHI
MDPIQDKQFDKQLQAKFNTYEPEVPAHLWGNIADKLNDHQVIPLKKKSTKFLWLKVAAAISAVIGMSLFYRNQPREIIYLRAAKTAENMPRQAVEVKHPPMETVQTLVGNQQEKVVGRPVTKARVRPVRSTEQAYPIVVTTVMHNAINDEVKQTAIVAVEQKPTMVTPDVQQMVRAELGVAQEVNLPAHVKTEMQEAPKGKKPFGMGNLLNAVISSVDQGEERIISFTNDSEGTIKVAVNLKALRTRL